MIATGGLLRMNRRQDSLRSKNRAENKRKRKAKKRKKNDVVVVKGKLNLCSPAGVVAAVGVAILMVGISMAVLGYWPSQNQQEYQERRRTGAHRGNRISYSKTLPVPSNQTSNNSPSNRADLFNQSHANSSLPDPSPSCGFLCEFLDNYLYSDNLKVFGPLVMGIGIFLFICANAVLHENRDKKTKIINLRDIYSTVIDLHSQRSKEYSPLNGLVNYTQSRSAEGPSGLRGASEMPSRSSWPCTRLSFQGESSGDEMFGRLSLASRPRSWSRDVQTFTDTVYSIYRDHSNSSELTPQPKQWETTSIVTSSVNAFTLPVIKLNNCEVEEKAGAGAASEGGVVSGAAGESGIEDGRAAGDHSVEVGNREREASAADPLPHLETHDTTLATTANQRGLEQVLSQWTQMQLFPPSPVARAMGSQLSLNSLTEQPRCARRCSLSVTVCRQGDRGRRFSCPRLERSNSKGYIKLTDLGGDSFEAPDTDVSPVDTDQEVASTAAAAEEEEAQVEEDRVTPSASAEA
ncbi:transmembrane protein 200C [Lampris incognitus]|uniref:transmembrane protein 200C n=1 Tax=Lampris incognitus TaxID=2546036 RepID=UPI0024B614DE|nr:transmembrane protein 200C [Lampris incognitus]